MHPLDDTIVAIASPPGGAARGIVRLSGPRVRACLETCFQPDGGEPHALARVGMCSQAQDVAASDAMPPPGLIPPARPEAIPGSLRLPGIASPLPCELYLWPDRRSYTGQPVAEIHALGCRPLLEAVLGALCAAGARIAEPGEFTLRAFLAGRIDLTQAEAVLGVIDAAGPKQLDVALAQLAGGLAGPLGGLRDKLVDLLADLEAGFDFADEDLPLITAEDLKGQLAEAAKDVAKLARQMASRGETAPVARAVLVGWPNVGKSSLFNALTRQAGALVSERPGTTRDYLTAELDLGGVKCQLIDTAGVAPELARVVPTDDAPASIEQAAQAASSEQSRRAHVQILCLESTRGPNDWERTQLEQTAGGVRVVVLTKIDIPKAGLAAGTRAGGWPGSSVSEPPEDQGPGGPPTHTSRRCPSTPATLSHNSRLLDGDLRRAVHTSSVTGEGVDALRDELRAAVLRAGAAGAEVVAGTAVRCRESLRLAAGSLRRARQIARTGTGEELVAAEIRVALSELGKVVGAVYTDDVLDRIFSRFCIGK